MNHLYTRFWFSGLWSSRYIGFSIKMKFAIYVMLATPQRISNTAFSWYSIQKFTENYSFLIYLLWYWHINTNFRYISILSGLFGWSISYIFGLFLLVTWTTSLTKVTAKQHQNPFNPFQESHPTRQPNLQDLQAGISVIKHKFLSMWGWDVWYLWNRLLWS